MEEISFASKESSIRSWEAIRKHVRDNLATIRALVGSKMTLRSAIRHVLSYGNNSPNFPRIIKYSDVPHVYSIYMQTVLTELFSKESEGNVEFALALGCDSDGDFEVVYRAGNLDGIGGVKGFIIHAKGFDHEWQEVFGYGFESLYCALVTTNGQPGGYVQWHRHIEDAILAVNARVTNIYRKQDAVVDGIDPEIRRGVRDAYVAMGNIVHGLSGEGGVLGNHGLVNDSKASNAMTLLLDRRIGLSDHMRKVPFIAAKQDEPYIEIFLRNSMLEETYWFFFKREVRRFVLELNGSVFIDVNGELFGTYSFREESRSPYDQLTAFLRGDDVVLRLHQSIV